MKKMILLLISALFATLLPAAESPAPEAQKIAGVQGTVNVDDFLNVRLGPNLKFPVAGKLLPGATVTITKISKNWLEIVAPATLPVYISEARVNADGKLNGELNMRSRMDVKAPTYGLLPAGSTVKRLDERANGWVRIAPPEYLRVYVASICVKFDRSQFDDNGLPKNNAPAEKPAPEEDKKEVTAPTAAPARTENFESDGIIIEWKYSTAPNTKYALLENAEGKNKAFITPDPATDISKLLNIPVTVSGTISERNDAGIPFVSAKIIKATAPETTAPATK